MNFLSHIFQLKKKYGGLGVVNELRKLRLLEEENMQLKKLVLDLSLDKDVARSQKKVLDESIKNEMSEWLVENDQVSIIWACRCVLLGRPNYYIYSSLKDRLLRMRINDMTNTSIRSDFEKFVTYLG